MTQLQQQEKEEKRAPQKPKTTFKKQRIVGQQDFVNPATGEVVPMHVVEIEDRDANFEKLWLGHILDVIEEIGTAKIKVLMHLMSVRSPVDNSVIATQEMIAKACGVSRKTVYSTLVALETHKIIKRHNSVAGVWMLNPNVIFKGTYNKRMNVLLRYHQDYQMDLNLEGNEVAVLEEAQAKNEREAINPVEMVSAEIVKIH